MPSQRSVVYGAAWVWGISPRPARGKRTPPLHRDLLPPQWRTSTDPLLWSLSMKHFTWIFAFGLLAALGCNDDRGGDIGVSPSFDTFADVGSDFDTDDGDTGDPEQAACERTGGLWDDLACGHYLCGLPNDCRAIDPGCNCGMGSNFREFLGCVRDDTCEDIGADVLCERSGGTWDPGACGHYTCGTPNACEALIPGCDCGSGANFDEALGCLPDPTCEPIPKDQVACESTGGRWDSNACGDYYCGEPKLCNAIVPGCDCGANMNYVPGDGCAEDPLCPQTSPEQQTCERTGGTWDPLACGHYACGLPNDCEAIIPGCNCGEGSNFTDAGCFPDEACASPDQEQALCEDSGGRWREDACGHLTCGVIDVNCFVPEPGCDCGSSGNFIPGQGCADDPNCTDPPSDDPALCAATGGTWDETSCGHYRCALAPACDAVIPGCNCGPDANWTDGQGCTYDASCQGINKTLCESTQGTWDDGSCGHYVCGERPTCRALIPGCDCGTDANFEGGVGCVTDAACVSAPDAQALCQKTGGTWEELTCGDYVCGARPTCKAIIPGCNCGLEQSFDPQRGCYDDTQCDDPELLCELTLGTWDTAACGHYTCGVPNTCEALIPGCDCGTSSIFNDLAGCITSQKCKACPDPRDPAVNYISPDPKVCATIAFRCERGYTAFNDACGCGCIQNP